MVWSPHVKADISRLVMVQHNAAHFVFNNFSTYSSVSSMLSKLNWQPLEKRRTIMQLSLCFIKSLTT